MHTFAWVWDHLKLNISKTEKLVVDYSALNINVAADVLPLEKWILHKHVQSSMTEVVYS